MTKKSVKARKSKIADLRSLCEVDLWSFARYIEPHRVYGEIHQKLFNWYQRPAAALNQLVLLPRDHQKSHCAAVCTAWEITKNPAISILYISASSSLACAQLDDIKKIITSDKYKLLWPEMVYEEEHRRAQWRQDSIKVDHPKRAAEGTRDSTVFCAGLTTNTTGKHCQLAYLDDVVVPDNAYTNEGRQRVRAAYSQLASVKTTGARVRVVGTRYHPDDLYQTLKEIHVDKHDDDGEIIDSVPLYEVFEREVETNGTFLWPRTIIDEEHVYGFNWNELAIKKAEYVDRTQFYAQYYNNPNNIESNRLTWDTFQKYSRKLLEDKFGSWVYNGRRLNVYAAVDLAFSMTKTADYTAIVTVGVDCHNDIYVLDIDRFKTDKMDEYINHILKAHSKWKFRKIRVEANGPQKAVATYIKDRARELGLRMSVELTRPGKRQGTKEERIAAILEPRYDNRSIYHGTGGYFPVLEEELVLSRPRHNDVKDALASAVENLIPPSVEHLIVHNEPTIQYHKRFGGVTYK